MKFRIKETKVLSLRYTVEVDVQKPDDHFIQLVESEKAEPKMRELLNSAWSGFHMSIAPELCEDGVGGTYFISDPLHQRIGVFKPLCGEPYNINNPKQFPPRRDPTFSGYKEGILIGEAALRECAAYLLDHGRFAGVPATDLVLAQHPAFYSAPSLDDEAEGDRGLAMTCLSAKTPLGRRGNHAVKLGSFQEYRQHDGNTEDLSPAIVAKFPLEQVQKIAVLDLRLFNTDRHGGNILYKEEKTISPVTPIPHAGNSRAMGISTSYQLIPIDHGYTLPASLSEAWFEWMMWPQAKVPLTETVKQYIRNLDSEKDVNLLKKKFGFAFKEVHFRTLRITTMLLKKGVEANLNLFQLACIVCRNEPKEPSDLEVMVAEATDRIQAGNLGDSGNFYKQLSELMDRHIKKEFGSVRRTRTI